VTKFLGVLAEEGKIFRQRFDLVACRFANPGWAANWRK
jgi:hypothetical protein